jgi:hypothetical protein
MSTSLPRPDAEQERTEDGPMMSRYEAEQLGTIVVSLRSVHSGRNAPLAFHYPHAPPVASLNEKVKKGSLSTVVG